VTLRGKAVAVSTKDISRNIWWWCDTQQLVHWIFDTIDTEKDGTVSQHELRLSAFDKRIALHWHMIDTNTDSALSRDEWRIFFARLRTQLGATFRSYILEVACASGSGDTSCAPRLLSQPAAVDGSCIACMDEVSDDGRQCRALPSISCLSTASDMVSCQLVHASAADTTWTAAFGAAFQDPACVWEHEQVSFTEHEMQGMGCSFLKAPHAADGYGVRVGIRVFSVNEGRVVTELLYNLQLRTRSSDAFGHGPVSIAITGPVTVPASPLKLSLHRSCEDELVSATADEQYASTTYPACMKASLCCGYSFDVVTDFAQSSTRSVPAGNRNTSTAYKLHPAADIFVDDLRDGNSATVVISKGGAEALVEFLPSTVSDESGVAHYHISGQVRTPSGAMETVVQTVPVILRRTVVADLPSIAALAASKRGTFIPKLILIGVAIAMGTVAAAVSVEAVRRRNTVRVPIEETAQLGQKQQPRRRRGGDAVTAYTHGGARYKTFDVA
jgi:hypothetical protein